MNYDFRYDSDAEFGARLKEQRESLNLLPHELSHKVGVTDFAQKQMEAGTKKITADYLQALDRYTDVDVMYVLRGELL